MSDPSNKIDYSDRQQPDFRNWRNPVTVDDNKQILTSLFTYPFELTCLHPNLSSMRCESKLKGSVQLYSKQGASDAALWPFLRLLHVHVCMKKYLRLSRKAQGPGALAAPFYD